MNQERGLSIIELTKHDSYLREIGSLYSTTHYYDVSINDEPESWEIFLVRKAFDKTEEKNYHGRLFEDHIEEPRAFAIVSNNKQVGWIELGYERWNNRMRVWEFLVEKEHRRKGIGTLLMNHAVKITKERGARMLVPETQTNVGGAIDFYLSYGFELIGLDIAAYSNQDIEKKEVRLELGLKI